MKPMRLSSLLFFFLFLFPVTFAQLKFGFYAKSCPQAELIVRQVVQRQFAADSSITGGFLRLHFHDCFVRGCDASVLIEPTTTQPSEKLAGANVGLRGFELIDEIKTQLEAVCPSTVSCADILALATRDSVALAGGPGYSLATGRRDGLVSDPNEVNLPGPTLSVPAALQSFLAKNMDILDMVVLLGAHTVGFANCGFFLDRISNFQATGRPDPTMDPKLAESLRNTCSAPAPPSVFLDQSTPLVVDNEFYKQIRVGRGILQLDQELVFDSLSGPIVERLASDNPGFLGLFADRMVKLGSVEVLTGSAGEIRRNCRVFN